MGAFLVGLLAPLLVVAAYFAAEGLLGRIWWAYVVLSPRTGERPLSYVVEGVRRYMLGHAPVMILAALGSLEALRHRSRPRLDLIVGMSLWLAIGAIAFALQGWFEYKWLLFTIPLGVLAAVGLETLVAEFRTTGAMARRALLVTFGAGAVLTFTIAASAPQLQTRLLTSVVIGGGAAVGALLSRRPKVRRSMLLAASAALAVSVGLAAIVPGHKIAMLEEHQFALSADDRTDLWRSWSPFYRAADRDLQTLGKPLPPEPLEVFGSSILLVRAGRLSANPFLAVRPEFYDGRVWRELLNDLRVRPPAYVVVDEFIGSVIRRRFPRLLEQIESNYAVAFVGATGTWYVRLDATGDRSPA